MESVDQRMRSTCAAQQLFSSVIRTYFEGEVFTFSSKGKFVGTGVFLRGRREIRSRAAQHYAEVRRESINSHNAADACLV
jgi:hypothetical protein